LASNADAFIIASGIQFLSEEHPYEKWANFPAAKKRFLDFLKSSKPKGVILLSGDRHIGEFSKTSIRGLDFPVYEITSSGMTHSATNNKGEANKFRVGPLVNQKHYGLMDITENNKKLTVKMHLKGIEGLVFHTEQVTF
jgi:alkaline phosphatase D